MAISLCAQLSLVESSAYINIASDNIPSWIMSFSKTNGACVNFRVPKTGRFNIIASHHLADNFAPFGCYADNSSRAHNGHVFYKWHWDHDISRFEVVKNTSNEIIMEIAGKGEDFYSFSQRIIIVPSGLRNEITFTNYKSSVTAFGSFMYYTPNMLDKTSATIWDSNTSPFTFSGTSGDKAVGLPVGIDYPFSLKLVSKLHDDLALRLKTVEVPAYMKQADQWQYWHAYMYYDHIQFSRMAFINRTGTVPVGVPQRLVYTYQIATKNGGVPDILDTDNNPHKPAGTLPTIQVFPNPFRSSIKIQIPGNGGNVKIFNLKGELIKNLTSDFCPLSSETTWNAQNMPPGPYLIRSKLGSKTLHKKIMLLQ
jgi:hypothetical protein